MHRNQQEVLVILEFQQAPPNQRARAEIKPSACLLPRLLIDLLLALLGRVGTQVHHLQRKALSLSDDLHAADRQRCGILCVAPRDAPATYPTSAEVLLDPIRHAAVALQ